MHLPVAYPPLALALNVSKRHRKSKQGDQSCAVSSTTRATGYQIQREVKAWKRTKGDAPFKQ